MKNSREDRFLTDTVAIELSVLYQKGKGVSLQWN